MFDPEADEGRGKRRKVEAIPGQQRAVALAPGKLLALREMRDPPGNSLGAVDEADAGTERLGQFVFHQREMSAGQHYSVDIRAAREKEAEPILLTSYEMLTKPGSNPLKEHVQLFRERIVTMYVLWGQNDKAEKWRAKGLGGNP